MTIDRIGGQVTVMFTRQTIHMV